MNAASLGYRKPALEERDPRNARFGAAEHMDTLSIPTTSRPKVWTPGKVLDQGATGRCTEFGLAGNRAASPNRITPPDDVHLTALYRESTLYDPWPDNDNDPTLNAGTSVHAAVECWRRHGMVGQYLWINDHATMNRWLDWIGPVVVGTDWFESMFTPVDKIGTLKVVPDEQGMGHCYCVLGRTAARGYRPIQSWGAWGQNGRFFISERDFWGKLADGLEAIGIVDA